MNLNSGNGSGSPNGFLQILKCQTIMNENIILKKSGMEMIK